MAVPAPAALVSPRSAPRPIHRARQRRGTRPGRGPGRLGRPTRAVPPSGRRNVTAPRVPGTQQRGRDSGGASVSIAAASACCRTDPSVRIGRRARSWHNHRAGGGHRPGGSREVDVSEHTDAGERTVTSQLGDPEFAESRARRAPMQTNVCTYARLIVARRPSSPLPSRSTLASDHGPHLRYPLKA